METIEERAKEYAMVAPLTDILGQEGWIYSQSKCDAYIAGATDQKAIDIDKAVEWIINTYLGDYITDEYGNGCIGDSAKLADDFRKAMED